MLELYVDDVCLSRSKHYASLLAYGYYFMVQSVEKNEGITIRIKSAITGKILAQMTVDKWSQI